MSESATWTAIARRAWAVVRLWFVRFGPDCPDCGMPMECDKRLNMQMTAMEKTWRCPECAEIRAFTEHVAALETQITGPIEIAANMIVSMDAITGMTVGEPGRITPFESAKRRVAMEMPKRVGRNSGREPWEDPKEFYFH